MIITDKPLVKKGHKKAVDLFLSGATVLDIANVCGLTPQGVYYIKKLYGLQRPIDARGYNNTVTALAAWLDVTNHRAEMIVRACKKIEASPCPAMSSLKNIGVTPKRHAHAQALYGARNKALSVFPIPYIMDYATGVLRKLSWVELVQAVSNPIKYMEDSQ